MFAARMAFRKHGPVVTPITSLVMGATGPGQPNEGDVQSIPYSFSGGVGPFTVTLRNQAGVSRATATATSGNFSYTANRNDTSLYFDVADSMGTTGRSNSYSFNVVFNQACNLTANSYTPATGTTTTLVANSTMSTAGARSYVWYYRISADGGATYSSYATFGGSSATQVTGANVAGERYQYLVNQTNPAGTVQSNQITVVTT